MSAKISIRKTIILNNTMRSSPLKQTAGQWLPLAGCLLDSYDKMVLVN